MISKLHIRRRKKEKFLGNFFDWIQYVAASVKCQTSHQSVNRLLQKTERKKITSPLFHFFMMFSCYYWNLNENNAFILFKSNCLFKTFIFSHDKQNHYKRKSFCFYLQIQIKCQIWSLGWTDLHGHWLTLHSNVIEIIRSWCSVNWNLVETNCSIWYASVYPWTEYPYPTIEQTLNTKFVLFPFRSSLGLVDFELP